MSRGGVITGQVVDEFGDPVIGANVMPMRSQFSRGQHQIVQSGGNSQTNDIGEFRLFGMNPGGYYIGVTYRPNQLGPAAQAQEDSTGYATTYYPGTPDTASAQRLSVAAGQYLSNINISLTPTRLAKISGTAFDSQGRPVTRGAVVAMSRSGMPGLQNGVGQLKGDGTFVIQNVSPGDYTLRATIAPSGPPAQGTIPTPPETSVAFVTVNGDVSGVALYPMKPITITGRIVFDDPAAGASIKPSTIRIVAQQLNPQDTIPIPGNPQSTVNDDLTFELKTAPGPSRCARSCPRNQLPRVPADLAPRCGR